MAHGNRIPADKGTILLVENVPFNFRTADGVRPVQNNNFCSRFSRPLDAKPHCGAVGIDAGTDVLEIDEQHVDGPKRFSRRLASLRIEAHHRDFELRVAAVARFDHVGLLFGKKPVLRRKKAAKASSGPRDQLLYVQQRRPRHGRLVRQEPQPRRTEPTGRIF